MNRSDNSKEGAERNGEVRAVRAGRGAHHQVHVLPYAEAVGVPRDFLQLRPNSKCYHINVSLIIVNTSCCISILLLIIKL